MAGAESRGGGWAQASGPRADRGTWESSEWAADLPQRRLWSRPGQVSECFTHPHTHTGTHVCITHMHAALGESGLAYDVKSGSSGGGGSVMGHMLRGAESKQHPARLRVRGRGLERGLGRAEGLTRWATSPLSSRTHKSPASAPQGSGRA